MLLKIFPCFQYLPDKDSMIKSTVETVFYNNFRLVDKNLSMLGLSTNHKQVIYMVLSAILNLGNIQFDSLTNGESYIENDSRKFFCNAAILLKIDESELEAALICQIKEMGKQQIK